MIRYIKNILFLSAVPISQIVRNLIIIFLMSKFMKIEEVGIWGQVLAIHAFLYMFINLNLTHSMSRFLPSQKSQIKKNSGIFYGITIIVFFNSLVVGIILIIFNYQLSNTFFKTIHYAYVFLYLSIFIILENIYNNIHSYFRSLQEFYYQAILTFFRTLFELSIVGGGIYFFHFIMKELNIKIIFYLFFSSLTLSIFVGFLTLYRKKFLVLIRPSFEFLKKYLEFGIPQLPSNLSYWIINLSDRLFISYFLGLKALGFYFIANRIGMIMMFPLSPIGTLLYTEGSKKFDNNENINKKKILILYTIFIVLLGVIAYWFSHMYIRYIVSEHIKEVLNLIFLIIISMVFYNIFSILNIFESIRKNSKKIGKVWTLVALVNIVANYLLIPSLGVIGAVISSGCSYLIGIMFILKGKIF